MKLKAQLALTLLLLAASPAYAASPYLGTWKLNLEKSKFARGATRNQTVVYEAVGDQIKLTIDGVDATGQAVHSEWIGKFDGKDYPSTGDPTVDTRAFSRVNDHILTVINKKNSKVTVSGKIEVSADGKTRTVITTATDPQGRRSTSVALYDKQ